MKKIVLASLILSMFGMAFAQSKSVASASSNKNTATKGLFANDVDNFSSVNGWSTVNPEKFFGFLGYNGNVNGIDYGMAHQFNKFYGAFYFNGKLDSFEGSTKKTSPKGGDSSEANNAQVKANGKFNTAFLYGAGDLGIRLDFDYVGYANSNSTETKAKETTKSGTTKFDLFPVLTVGINNKAVKSWAASYTVYGGYDGRFNTSYSGKATQDDSFGYVVLGGAMNLNKDASEKANQNWNIGLVADIGVYPKKVQWDDKNEVNQDGKGYFRMNVSPNYTYTYKATDKVTLKAGAGATVGFNVTSTEKSRSVAGSTVYEPNPYTSTNIYITPNLKVGMVAAPEFKKINFPVDLNFGASFTVPRMNVNFTKAETVTAKGDVMNTTESTTFNFYTADGKLSFGSGITAKPLSFLTLDCTYDVVADIFGDDFTSDLTEGNNNFWNTVNKVLVHNVTIQASVKL